MNSQARLFVALAILFTLSTSVLRGQSSAWRLVDSGRIDMRYRGISCADSLHCATCTDYQNRLGLIRITNDGGLTWETVFGNVALLDHPSAFDTIKLFDIARPSVGTIVALGDYCRILVSHDTGRTWSTVRIEPTEAATFVMMHDENNGVAIMYLRRLALTNDGWKTWRIVTVPDSIPSGTFNRGVYVDSLVILVGHFLNGTGKPTIVRYRIDTDEWTYFDNIDFEFYPLDFIDSLNGWACGPPGNLGPARPPVMNHTTDGGVTWTPQPVNSSWRNGGMIDVSFVNGRVGYASGVGDFVIRTSNGGDSWEREDLPVTVAGIINMFVAPLTETNAIAVTKFGLIFRREMPASTRREDQMKQITVNAHEESAGNSIVLDVSAKPFSTTSGAMFNNLGQEIVALPEKVADGNGHTEYVVSSLAFPPGLYLARVVAGNEVATAKVMVIR